MKRIAENDAKLVYQIQNGNETAFNELYERYHKLVFFIAYQFTKCEADAEEIKQEVFIKVLRHIHDIKDANRFKYWLTTVTHNECKHLFRNNKDKEMSSAQQVLLYHQTESRRDFLPEQQAHYVSDMEVLKACLLRLNVEQREVVTLKYFAQLSIDEIAAMLQIPNGTVKSRLAYAKKQLKSDVETYCRKYDITLSFHMESLGAVCALLLAQEQIVVPLSSFSWRYLHHASLTKIGIALAVSVGTVGGYALYHQRYMAPSSMTNESYRSFDARETYIQLKHWAHCEVELAEKNETEKAVMRDKYEQLKEHGNYYYILLEQYWNHTFD